MSQMGHGHGIRFLSTNPGLLLEASDLPEWHNSITAQRFEHRLSYIDSGSTFAVTVPF